MPPRHHRKFRNKNYEERGDYWKSNRNASTSTSYSGSPMTSGHKNQSRNKRHLKGKKQESWNTSDSSKAEDDLEIPGFYYDAEKKRYFKILPGHNNTSGAITNDAIKKKKIEIKRKQDLNAEKLTRYQGRNKYSNSRPSVITVNNLFHSLSLQMLGLKPSLSVQDLTYSVFAKKLSPCRQISLCPQRTVEGPLHMLLNEHQDEIWNVSSEKNKIGCGLKLLKVKNNIGLSSNNLNISSPHLDIATSFSCSSSVPENVTSICHAPLNNAEKSSSILYTSVCPMGRDTSKAYLKRYVGGSLTGGDIFPLGVKATWSCAWNAWSQQFCVGSEKCALLLDTATRYLWQMETKNSDVLSQTFAGQNGNLLLSGTRAGRICHHDLRVSRSSYTSCLTHASSVCSLRVMQDGYYLIASDFSGQIKRWDFRQNKVVQSYKGHVNEYKILPVQMDESESLLYAVGQDGYTRFWNITTSECVKTIAPPLPVSVQSLPVVLYSSSWGGTPGNMGLVMAIGDELHIYGTKDDR